MNVPYDSYGLSSCIITTQAPVFALGALRDGTLVRVSTVSPPFHVSLLLFLQSILPWLGRVLRAEYEN